MTTVAVIGAGYVGLTTAACLAHLGHEVRCAEASAERVALLRAGTSPISELGMDDLLREGLSSGRLSFGTDNARAVDGAQVVFLCVPTPQGDDGHADMSFVQAAVLSMSGALADGAVIVNKSTVPVGSAEKVKTLIGRRDVSVVSNPEFLREGNAVYDFLNPDRIVVGSDERWAAMRVAQLYNQLQAPVVVTSARSAETIKYASNAFLALKASFANTMAAFCEEVGAEAGEVLRAVGMDRRIGGQFLQPGPGWGGSCLPKDTKALVAMGEDAGYDVALVRSAIAVNDAQYRRVLDQLTALAGGSLCGRTVALLGLTFKANTDDLRDSPALRLAASLNQAGAVVVAYDPAVPAGSVLPIRGCDVAGSAYEAVAGADVVGVVTEWEEFSRLDPERLALAMASPNVLDTRCVLDREAFVVAGFTFAAIGSPSPAAPQLELAGASALPSSAVA
ncbi:MAG TPA: UDP-glucose/GDP-mannose dehydrogenase family protein [Acidimicrobiales bacterium]|nr:UDP-glucose/GDP-mannose dehydrogenase family protein [Acidimicrobiales bacterium]